MANPQRKNITYGKNKKSVSGTSKNRAGKRIAELNRRYKENSRTLEGDIDYTFLSIVILMVSFGLVMLLSASAPTASNLYDGDSYGLFKKQLAFVIVGLFGMWFVSRINFNRYKKYVPMFMLICVFMLMLVAVPFIGKSINGARRWLPIPGIQLQPSEFMKPVIAMYFALQIEQGKHDLKTLRGNLPFLGWIALVVALMLLEPHLSGAIIIAGIGVVLMIAGGMPIKPLLIGIIPVGVLVVGGVYLLSPVRWDRIMSFLHPFDDIQNTGYQVTQGLYAIGSGGIFGLGLGQSVQKYSYLPEPYNDFIFAIICEELGLFGAIIVILLFVALILRALRIAMNAPDTYSTLTGIGITAQIAIQTTLNIAVATSSVPNTGVSLPFFSYGGTAIMTLLLEMGVLLNISRYSNKNVKL
jgi:cell division protein FtsW